MKTNVILALFGSASAIKVESQTSSQVESKASSQFWMPAAMLHKVCATRPKVWKVPATLKCDYQKGEYPQYVEAADGTTCEYACNRRAICTVENRCLPQPQIHETCKTRPAKWSPPSTLKCVSTPTKRLFVDYVFWGGACEYACNGPKGGCTVENHCLPAPMLHKSCPYTMHPKGFTYTPPKTLTCDATKGLNVMYVEKADGKTCEWACNSLKVCTLLNGCIPAPSLLKTCPISKRPADWYKAPANLTCPSNKRQDYVEIEIGGAPGCKWECNGQLPCVSGQPKTTTSGYPICDASVPETPAKTTGLPAIGGTTGGLPAIGGTTTGGGMTAANGAVCTATVGCAATSCCATVKATAAGTTAAANTTVCIPTGTAISGSVTISAQIPGIVSSGGGGTTTAFAMAACPAAAATVDATTLGAPAGTATVTYVFYETPNKTAATQ